MPRTPLARLRALCRVLPGFHEVEAWGEPTFRVRNKLFAMYASAGTHHGNGRPAVWIKAAPEHQAMLLQFRPARFFRPPYVGPAGWIGVWLDGAVPWNDVRELLEDGWRMTASRRLQS